MDNELILKAGMKLLIAKRVCTVVEVTDGKCIVHDSTVGQNFVIAVHA